MSNTSFVVTDSNFKEACEKASYWSRKRCFKKMRKVTFRRARYEPKLGRVVRDPLPPSDVEQWVANWVETNVSKPSNLGGVNCAKA